MHARRFGHRQENPNFMCVAARLAVEHDDKCPRATPRWKPLKVGCSAVACGHVYLRDTALLESVVKRRSTSGHNRDCI